MEFTAFEPALLNFTFFSPMYSIFPPLATTYFTLHSGLVRQHVFRQHGLGSSGVDTDPARSTLLQVHVNLQRTNFDILAQRLEPVR